ncbi:MAG: hypothetical protein JW832_14500 [Deltaproteobacteria bacterium]|nr:hypothetical protein [Deltaproteobacteria bacterium]
MNPVIREAMICIVIVGVTFLYFINTNNHSLGLALFFYGYPAYLLIRLLIWSIMALISYYKKLKIEQKPLLNKTTLSIGVSVIAVVLILACYDFIKATGPTAIVIDAETGKPVEGAIALAQWFRPAGGGLFEGGVDNLDKAAEAFSDKDGKVDIDGFWGLYIFSGQPRLTVYKPGYVLWDSRRICPTLEGRTDFDEKRRTVKLLKFDTEGPKWVEKYPKEGGPRGMQVLFFSSCYNSEVSRKYQHNEITIQTNFDKYELPLFKKEKMERSQKIKQK